jgi:hypothetical protein
VKKVLVILTQANLAHLQTHESISATMVLATFGAEVKVLMKDAALSLLQSELKFNQFKHAFKIASNMVDSFEFYDLSPIYVEEKNKDSAFIHADLDIEYVQLNTQFIQQFDHVLYW